MRQKFLNNLIKKLRYKRYAKRTIDVYVSYISEFLDRENVRDPYQVSIKNIEEYLLSYTYTSCPQQNQIISSLKCYAKFVLKRSDVNISKIERPKSQKRLQPVIPRETIIKVLPNIKNLKHKTIITLAYSCALRVSEVVNLQWKHVLRDEMIIEIKNSKGGKDRIVPINDNIILLLTEYWKQYRTNNYLFSGSSTSDKYSPQSCNAIVKSAFGSRYRFHSLRKSASTHLYELGDDLAKIQDLLGHNSSETTRIYVNSGTKSIHHLTQLV